MLNPWKGGVRRVLVTIAVAVGLVAAGATPAHAATVWPVLSDGFENNPQASWWFENTGPTSYGMFDRGIGPRTGVANANIGRWSTGWNSIDHWLTLPALSSYPTRSCSAHAYFLGDTGNNVNIEIIDPVSWTYVALGIFPLTWQSGYQAQSITWSGGPDDVVLRFVVVDLTGTTVVMDIDDVAITCTTP